MKTPFQRTLAAVALTAALSASGGMVYYHPPVPLQMYVVTSTNSTASWLAIDIDQDGATDFGFSIGTWPTNRRPPGNGMDFLNSAYTNSSSAALIAGMVWATDGSGRAYVMKKALGDPVYLPDAGMYPFSQGFPPVDLIAPWLQSNVTNAWDLNQDGYAGFQLMMTNGPHYGWIRISNEMHRSSYTDEDFTFKVHEWAYSDSPNLNVVVGQSENNATEWHFVAGSAHIQAGEFYADIAGPPASQVQIWGSADLIEWAPITLLMNQNGTVQFHEPLAAGRKFYRLSSP